MLHFRKKKENNIMWVSSVGLHAFTVYFMVRTYCILRELYFFIFTEVEKLEILILYSKSVD